MRNIATWCSLSAFLLIGTAMPVQAQMVQVSLYIDGTVFEGGMDVYATFYDESDLSPWGGLVYHYDYSGAIDVSCLNSSGGSIGGAGTGSWTFTIALGGNEEDECAFSGVLSFICSSAGGLQGGASAPDPAATFSFSHHYDFSYFDAGWKIYVRNADSSGRKCAPPEVQYDGSFAMSITGSGFGGTVGAIGACIRHCYAGTSGPVLGPAGSFYSSGRGTC